MERKKKQKNVGNPTKGDNKSTNGQMDIAQSIRPFSQQHPWTKEKSKRTNKNTAE
jgi:hypothetical protein